MGERGVCLFWKELQREEVCEMPASVVRYGPLTVQVRSPELFILYVSFKFRSV